ncbi:helix-turn-helix transcriptional regulator [Nonomuraea sp. NPDC049709]|uniref:helix-turn-helix domain-containing protein n=1 Tax=Nonomuraea sp. NPDC049709 TaxID=3154736 RepID=UPI003444A6B0
MGEETFGQVLRDLRGNRTLEAVAHAAGISTSYVYKLENDQRKPARRVVEALEVATNAQGALIEASERNGKKSASNADTFPPIATKSPVRTLDINDHYGETGEDATERRRLFGLAASAGIVGFDEIVRQELDHTTDRPRSAEDWDITRADHLHALRTRPPAQVIKDLSIDLYALRQQMHTTSGDELTELYRVAALLAVIQANALTRVSDHGAAIRWWSTARKTADASRDLELRLLVRSEEAIHGLYGQREPETVLRLIENARRISRRPWPRLMTARAKALALLNRSKEAADTLRDLHDHMDKGIVGDRWEFFKPDQIPFAESWVAAYSHNEAAADAARGRVLQIIPERSYQYRMNAVLHEAISTAALGGADEGARLAAELIDSLPAGFRTNHIWETARMVLRAVPLEQRERPAVGELRSLLTIEP